MNIFALSRCPIESTVQMIDKHIVKMPTETCQMLHTNALFQEFSDIYGYEPSLARLKEYHEESGSILMKPAMLNHPSTIWARQNIHNTLWLYQHGMALCEEYTFRYGKVHGTYNRMLQTPMEFDADSNLATPVHIAMFDVYRLDRNDYPHLSDWDFVIKSYQHYYLEAKWSFANWKSRDIPSWWPKDHIEKKYAPVREAYQRKIEEYRRKALENL